MKRLFTFFACLLLTAASVSAQTAQAIVTYDGFLFFDYSSTTYTINGTYEGHLIQMVYSGDAVLNSGANPAWMGLPYQNVTVKESFKQVYPKSTAYWFFGAGNGVAGINGLENLNTELVADMSGMFFGYRGNELDLSHFDTSRVTSMDMMFFQCAQLKELDLSYFDTSRVTSMKQMFYNSPSLQKMNLLNFDTSKVTNVEGMFANCKSLTTIYCNDSWSVSTSGAMFTGCESLVGAVPFDSSKTDASMANPETGYFTKSAGTAQAIVTQNGTLYLTMSPQHIKVGEQYSGSKVAALFTGDEVLNSGYSAPGWTNTTVEVTKVIIEESFSDAHPTSTAYWFASYQEYKEVDLYLMKNRISSITGLDYLNTDKVTNMKAMFAGCSMTTLNLSHFDTTNVTNMMYMFFFCPQLTLLDLSGFNTANVTDMSHMFRRCYELTSVDLSSFDTSKVTTMMDMFSFCSKLSSLDVSSFNTSRVTNMAEMFNQCSSLKELDLSAFDTSNVTNMRYMFYKCAGLTELDLSGFDTSETIQMRWMFNDCNNLRTIYCNDTWTASDDNGIDMFSGCTNLSGASFYDSSKTDVSMANPQNGYFTRIEAYDLWICGKQVTKALADDLTRIDGVSINSGNRGYATYDPQTKTLKLKDVFFDDETEVLLRSKIDGLTIQVDKGDISPSVCMMAPDSKPALLLESATTFTGEGEFIVQARWNSIGINLLSDVYVKDFNMNIAGGAVCLMGAGTLHVEGMSYVRIQGLPCVKDLGGLDLGKGVVISYPEYAQFINGMIVKGDVSLNTPFNGHVIIEFNLPGDVNNDGDVNINDVVAVINHMAGTADWLPKANVNGDKTADGKDQVDINDVVAIINIMAGK